MKKALGFVFFLCMFSVALFAEFVLNPTIGYSGLSSKESVYAYAAGIVAGGNKDDIKFSSNYFTLGLGIGYQPNNKNGFYFMWNNDFGLVGNFKMESQSSKPIFNSLTPQTDKKGLFYKTNLIFGGAIVPIDKLYITIGSGFSVSVHHRSSKFKALGGEGEIDMIGVGLGLPLDLSISYYFTDKIGLVFGLNDTLNFAIKRVYVCGSTGSYQNMVTGISLGFENNFNLRIGPSFKF